MNGETLMVSDKLAQLKANLRLPVISAPMFLVSGPDMVIAATRAGIMGCFPAPNARTVDDLRQWLTRIQQEQRSDDAPWAMNMITHSSYGRFDEELALVDEFRPPLCITALGGPHRVTSTVHAYGGLVFADVNSPMFARKAIDKGADGLILVCAGAGGHTGEYAMLPFIEEVRGFFDGPLVVGGGIGSGAAIRAVECLGVDFAYMGTRFLTARETLISDEYRRMAWDSQMQDLIASRAITGALGLWLKASVEAAGIPEQALSADKKVDFSDDMHADNKVWKHVWSAGQGVGGLRQPESVAEIADALKVQYNAAIAGESERSLYASRP